MKQRVKVPVKENKEKHQRVYGIHDLLFLPLIIGMAFTKKEDEKRQIDEEVIFSRQQVEDNFNEEIQEVENKLNQITLEANDSKNEDSLDQDNTLLILNIEKKEKFDQLQEEIDDIEKQLFALVIDDKEYIITDDSLTLSKDVDYNEEELQEEKIIEVPQKAIEEYHTWLEELPIQEKFYDIKEKEMEVYSDIILDKETFDLSDYEENQIELKRQIEEVTKTLAKQDKELDKVKTQLALPVSYIEKVNIEVRFTSHILLENLVLTHAISKAKINPVSKLVLQTMVINRTLKQSRRAVRKKEKLPPVNFEKQLYAVLSDTRYMETMLNEAILQSKKMKKEFLIEFSQYKDQIPEYDGLIKQYDNIEKNLQEKKKSLGSLQNNIEKAKQKNKQKQMEYLN